METCFEEDEKKWCDLPKDVLLSILQLLNLKTDLPRLRGVCSCWRSLLPHPNNLPLSPRIRVPNNIITPHQFITNKPSSSSLILIKTRFFLLSPLPTCHIDTKWVAKMFEIESNKWHLLNPLSMQDLFMTVPPITGTINLCDCRVLQLSRTFSLLDNSLEGKAEVVSEKVVVISDSNNEDVKYCMVLTLVQGRIFFLRLGDEEWCEIEALRNHKFLDIASHRSKFYAYDSNIRKLVVIDPATWKHFFIDGPSILEEHLDVQNMDVYGLYFVEASNGCLHLVVMVSPIGNRFTMVIFMLKEKEVRENCISSWEQVKCLGDEIFFIGTDASFTLPFAAQHLPQWKPGSVCLFVKPAPLIFGGCVKENMPEGAECLNRISYAEYFRYFEMFHVGEQDGWMVPFQELSKEVYTRVFFPPPSWVKWHCSTLGNVQVRLDNLQYHCEDDDADYYYQEYLDDNEED